MSAYVIVDIGLHDPEHQEAFAAYAEQTNALLAAAGARVIAFDPSPDVLEGDWRPRAVVVQEYPDRAAVEAFAHSAAYAPLRALRQRIADARIVVVDGTS